MNNCAWIFQVIALVWAPEIVRIEAICDEMSANYSMVSSPSTVLYLYRGHLLNPARGLQDARGVAQRACNVGSHPGATSKGVRDQPLRIWSGPPAAPPRTSNKSSCICLA